ncbi:MAG: DUF1844 domain-containing protein [Thermodesulfobacteriota bacterium]|nr:DUF1844 domain-containing protein [Thermodesulfobacteriota bacterium]
MPEEVEGNGFVIKDKRAFDSRGDSKIEAEDAVKDEVKEEVKEKVKEEVKKEEMTGPLPEVNFSSFILSLSSSVLLHLGEIADPISGEKRKNMDLAKQSIDIISMLQDKTKGNISQDEEKLIEQMLFDLRMRFFEASK